MRHACCCIFAYKTNIAFLWGKKGGRGGGEGGGGVGRMIQWSEQWDHAQGSSTATAWVQMSDDAEASQQQAVTAMQDSPAAQLSLPSPRHTHSTLDTVHIAGHQIA